MSIQNYGALAGTIIDKLDSPSAMRKKQGRNCFGNTIRTEIVLRLL